MGIEMREALAEHILRPREPLRFFPGHQTANIMIKAALGSMISLVFDTDCECVTNQSTSRLCSITLANSLGCHFPLPELSRTT